VKAGCVALGPKKIGDPPVQANADFCFFEQEHAAGSPSNSAVWGAERKVEVEDIFILNSNRLSGIRLT